MSIYSAGIDYGKEIGEELKILKQICKKLSKGKSEDVIADELEEDIGFIRKVVDFAAVFAPKYDEEAVLGAWLRLKEGK